MEQGSEEWFIARAGKVSSSRIKDIVPGKRGEYLKAREDYKMQLLAEILTNTPKQEINAKELDWGKTQEGAAVFAYEVHTGLNVDRCGFIEKTNLFGGSPDGLVGEDGCIEIKCPFNPSNHIYTLLNGTPEEHIWQCQSNLLVTGREWIDFISYRPDMPDSMKLYIKRTFRDEEKIAVIQKEVEKFTEELNQLLCEIKLKFKIDEVIHG